MALFLLLPVGCGYLTARGEDFAECWKAEAHLTLGIAWVQAGPIAQNGLGFPEGPYVGMTLGGWRYGYDIPRQEGHSRFATSVYGIIGHASSLTGVEDDPTQHRCFVLLPPLLSMEGIHRYPLHSFDVEVGVGMIFGGTVGFSPGQFLDFLLGWFGIDIAGDDDPQKRRSRNEAKNYYRAKAGMAPEMAAQSP